MRTVFLRVLEIYDKAEGLQAAIREPEAAQSKQRFEVDPTNFAAVPGSPFAYWVGERLRRLFKELPAFESNGRTAKVGLQTSDNFRFLRVAWEVPLSKTVRRWFPYAKGGTYSPFYSDLPLVVRWEGGGHEAKAWASSLYDNSHWSRILKNVEFLFRPGITWPARTTSKLSVRALTRGACFDTKGCAAFVTGDGESDILELLSVTNSRQFHALINLQLAAADAAARSYDVGVFQRTPVPRGSRSEQSKLSALARRAWSLRRSVDTRTETSHAFTLPALLQVAGADVAARAAGWAERVRTVEAELATIQAEIDERSFELYGIDEADRHSITEGLGVQSTKEGSSDDANVNEDDAREDDDEDVSTADATGLAAELAAWGVGVAFGRFDVRLPTSARPLPSEPEPFDPLPACSPGMLTGEDGMPRPHASSGYPLAFPESGVLVDDPGHAHDLTAAVRAVFDVVFGADSDHWWNDVAALLDPKGHDFRVWLAGDFFEHHLKRYSKSRRKAPILWQLGTPSGRYSIWLYAHRLTRDSFFQLQNEVVGPKLAHEERQLTSLMQKAGGSPSASERREISAQEVFVEELRAMLEEVKRIAPLWNPNLDDGVVLTMAPLWRLIPQHKPWQKELKSKWGELAAGNYDWAHIAMHLWPERVVPKCATDRSLAIAHGLEDVFWVEGTDGKWKARSKPAKSVDELIRERSSTAVKAALKSLLDAPTASGAVSPASRRVTPPAVAEARGR